MAINQEALNSVLAELKSYPRSRLVAVTKNRSTEEIQELLAKGVSIIGENRLQEAASKLPHLSPKTTEKHLIGHLQTNKVGKALEIFDVIQSVDSQKLAAKINQVASKKQIVMPIMLQVNISNDIHKFGFSEKQLLLSIKKIVQLKHLKLSGLMTLLMADLTSSEQDFYYKKMWVLYKKITQLLSIKEEFFQLSMGMSNDYQIALKNGASMIRIGRKLFK
jgi:pyridoxal phosphate enzyme (YggS family)